MLLVELIGKSKYCSCNIKTNIISLLPRKVKITTLFSNNINISCSLFSWFKSWINSHEFNYFYTLLLLWGLCSCCEEFGLLVRILLLLWGYCSCCEDCSLFCHYALFYFCFPVDMMRYFHNILYVCLRRINCISGKQENTLDKRHCGNTQDNKDLS